MWDRDLDWLGRDGLVLGWIPGQHPLSHASQNIDTALGVRGWEEGRQMGHRLIISRLSSFVNARCLAEILSSARIGYDSLLHFNTTVGWHV